MEDDDVTSLDRVVDAVGVPRRRKDTNLGIGADNADEWIAQQPLNSTAQMQADAIGGCWRAMGGNITADISNILESASVPAKTHGQGL